ncbi:MAG: hypothetical protein HN337_09135 [Deltaproteobacteria bacterium]|jgi:hypothetical protein|nr:hypothetical protein [Deltaproteobacteria bacterium]
MIYKCPHCDSQFQAIMGEVVECPTCHGKVRLEEIVQNGCEWDREVGGNWLEAFFNTFKAAVSDSAKFFASVSRVEGMKRAYIYALIISYVMFATMVAYQIGFQALALSLNLGGDLGADIFPALAVSIPIGAIFLLIFFVIGVPVFTAAMMFVRAGLYHVCLMILGSVKRDFQTTFRVVCYASSPQLFQLVPILGGMVAWIWQLVLDIIGIKEAHQTSYGRSALAVFLPTIICCGVGILFITMMAGVIAAAIVRSS